MPKKKNKSSEQKAAEAEIESFRKDLGPFVTAAEKTRMAMVFTDAKEPDNPIIFANDSFLSLTGYDREEVLGHSFNFLMARGTDPETLVQVETAFEGSSDSDLELRYRRKDGSIFWAAIFISPVQDESGDVVQHFASFLDLSKHKQEQAQSKMLIDELNHRVKNTLSTVQSIVWQALRNDSDPEVVRESIESRLFALSRSHDLLARENWESAGLFDLINNVLEAFSVTDGHAERFVVTGQNIRFPPKIALALGIAFHELMTNAVKYGALSNETGSILIAWTIEPTSQGDQLRLRWQESGGPPVMPSGRKGFGSRLIEEGLALELDGEVHLEYEPAGVVCQIVMLVPQEGG